MKTRIIEIIELGEVLSLIHREGKPTTELIETNSLIDEINTQLKIDYSSKIKQDNISTNFGLEYCYSLM